MITARPATRMRTALRPVPLKDRGDQINSARKREATHAPGVDPEHGGRRQRRLERRRRVREEIIVGAVLATALVITILILALQWLDSPSSVAVGPGSDSFHYQRRSHMSISVGFNT